MVNNRNKLGRHVVSAKSIGSFKRRLDQSMNRDDRWDGKILDYSKGGGQGTASCRSLTGWPLAVSTIHEKKCYSCS